MFVCAIIVGITVEIIEIGEATECIDGAKNHLVQSMNERTNERKKKCGRGEHHHEQKQ